MTSPITPSSHASTDEAAEDRARRRGRRRGVEVALWIAAVVMMLAAAAYQRLTGPTIPLRGEFQVEGQSYKYRLKRSDWSTADARVSISDPGQGVTGSIYYKRFKTQDDFAPLPLASEDDQLVGYLPAQPPAGKLEYFIELEASGGQVRIPSPDEGTVVIRFKDRVPLYVLLPHVIFMFFSVLIGMRTGLAALFAPAAMRRLAWTTLALMTIGGMILGPIAQKYAFGAFWTGFPFGYDLTDNKVLIMWLVWVIACAVVGRRAGRNELRARSIVVGAALVMAVVYVIPHSAQGSELDYEALERGVPASEAIRTGGN